MQNDTNTYGYNQWFYFSIRNMKVNTKYTFRIANFVFIQIFRKNLILSLIMAFNLCCSHFSEVENKDQLGTVMVCKLVTILRTSHNQAVKDTILYNSLSISNTQTIT